MENRNAWMKYPKGAERQKVMDFAESYRKFISDCKTERECVMEFEKQAKDAGFAELHTLIEKGTQIKGHEFHYWQSEGSFEDCMAVKPITGKKWFGSFARDNIFAGFGHLYFLSNTKIAENFLKSCIFYKEKINGTL